MRRWMLAALIAVGVVVAAGLAGAVALGLVTLERHMDCGVGLCGHCQLGPLLLCRDGPVVASGPKRPPFGSCEVTSGPSWMSGAVIVTSRRSVESGGTGCRCTTPVSMCLWTSAA